jgi:hypothetical protein
MDPFRTAYTFVTDATTGGACGLITFSRARRPRIMPMGGSRAG